MNTLRNRVRAVVKAFPSRLWLPVVGLIVAACLTASEVPKPSTLNSLVPKQADANGTNNEFAIVHYGPVDAATSDATINVVFSKAIRELTTSNEDAPIPVILTPSIPGTWQFIGTHGVQFHPAAGQLPLGTNLRVSVPAGIKAVSGEVLNKPLDFAFFTPAPRVVSHQPFDGAQSQPLKPSVVFGFDQPVEESALANKLTLRAAGKAVAFSLEQGPPKDGTYWLATPKTALPKNTQVRVELAAGLHSVGGDVESPHAKSFSFRTYGPLTATARCGYSECSPETNVTLEFSNEVALAELKKRVSITPEANIQWPDWYDADTRSKNFSFDIKGTPRTAYQLSIAPGLADEYGQVLQGTSTFTFSTTDYWSSLSVGLSGEVLQPASLGKVPIRSRNVKSYDLRVLAANPLAVIQHQDNRWDVDAKRWAVAPVRINPGITNRFHDHNVDLSASLAAASSTDSSLRGAVLLAAEYIPNGSDYTTGDRKLVQVTDLGMTAKLSQQGTLVWVTRMSTGQPLAGASVELWSDGKLQRNYTTDADGLVTVPTSDYVPRLNEGARGVGFVARHQGDWIAQSETTFMGPWRMPIYPQLYAQDTKVTYMFTERGLYRPGDNVWVKGIVRDEADTATPTRGGMVVVAERNFELQLFDPNDTVIAKHPIKTNQFGTFAHQLSVPASAALGSFRIALREPSQQRPAYELPTAYFSVAEYEPAEFQVSASAEQTAYVNGATAGFGTESQFLYGAPVAEGAVHYTLTYEATSFEPPHSGGFETSDSAYQSGLDSEAPQYGLITDGDAKLDAQGVWRTREKLAVNGQNTPLRIRFESSVTDVSRKTISASAQTLLHPADFYLGIKHLDDWFVAAPSTFRPQVLALSPDGKRLPNQRVEVSLLRRRWTSVREVWEGGYRQVYRRLDEPVSQCTLKTVTKEQSCDLPLTEGGSYIVRAKSADAAGRPVYASMEFYAIGDGRADWRDDAVNAQMDIVANKQEYKVGETARILVKSPFTSGDALVTVERAGVLERRRMTLKGGTPVIEVPITEAMRPNAFVSVHLLKRRNAKSAVATTGDELYRIGYTELRLEASQRKLDVTVAPTANTVRPKDKVVVDVQVKDVAGKGKASEVTFYAVDEGVLMLSGYQLPDPVSRFTAPRPLRVATIESRSDLARIFEPLAPNGSNKGAEGGGGGGARSDFKQSAYFNPNVLTDENGRARVEFQAPDNLTTFRLMAVAVSKDDRYGGGQGKIIVDKPLMARPALPRFLRAGDRFSAAVAVSTKGAKSKNVEVALEVGGGLQLEGDAVQRIQVSSDGVKEVRFPVVAKAAGEASLTFAITGEAERDSVKLTRRVHSPAQLEAVAAYGETRGVDGQRLGRLDEVRADMGGLEVTLAATRLVGLSGSMEALVEYPYECTEQLASKLLPVLPLSELAKEFGFTPPTNARALGERTTRLILERQRADGGFGFWKESLSSHPYLSAYTLWTLSLASKHGVKVSKDVFERGLTYLRKVVNHPTTDEAELEKHGLSRDLQAFTAMVMGALDANDMGAIERLVEQRKDMGLLGHAWLLAAAVNAKAPASLREPLLKRLESSVTVVGNRASVENADGRYLDSLFASALKLQALVLDALLLQQPKHPLAGKLVAELLWRREGGTWRTTQESAFALLAIDRYWKLQEKESPRFDAKVWVGDKPLLHHTFDGRSTSAVVRDVTMSSLQSSGSLDVVFERSAASMLPATGTLFYEARLKYARNEVPRTSLDRGFSVQKVVRAARPSELAATMRSIGSSVDTIDAKQLAVVDLLVIAPNPRRFVVVDDPIPAGLTAFDSSLATSSSHMADLESREPVQSGFSEAWSRRELRDDRALFFVDDMPAGMYHFRYLASPHTPGKFVVPPTRVSEMYQPEVYGRTGATDLTVTVTQ